MRANAGDCIEFKLTNNLPAELADLAGWNTVPMIVEGFNANQVKPSNQVGLHPQLVAYDVTDSDGANVGMNVANNVDPITGQTRNRRSLLGRRSLTSGTQATCARMARRVLPLRSSLARPT